AQGRKRTVLYESHIFGKPSGVGHTHRRIIDSERRAPRAVPVAVFEWNTHGRPLPRLLRFAKRPAFSGSPIRNSAGSVRVWKRRPRPWRDSHSRVSCCLCGPTCRVRPDRQLDCSDHGGSELEYGAEKELSVMRRHNLLILAATYAS